MSFLDALRRPAVSVHSTICDRELPGLGPATWPEAVAQDSSRLPNRQHVDEWPVGSLDVKVHSEWTLATVLSYHVLAVYEALQDPRADGRHWR